MTYFLDFDRTLLNTDAFLDKLVKRPEFALYPEYEVLKGPRIQERALAFARLLSDGRLSLKPSELAPFLYDDVSDFIQSHPSVVITYGGLAWQTAKVESAFGGVPPIPVIYTEFEAKGPVLAREIQKYESPHIFTDDNPEYLDSVVEHCPQVSVYEMRRDGKEGCGRYPVVRSLTELP